MTLNSAEGEEFRLRNKSKFRGIPRYSVNYYEKTLLFVKLQGITRITYKIIHVNGHERTPYMVINVHSNLHGHEQT